MAGQSIADRLKLLNSEEAAVLYWAFQGETDKQIADRKRVRWSKEQIRTIRLNALSTIRPYGFDTEVRGVIERMTGSPPRFDPWPPEGFEEPEVEEEPVIVEVPEESPTSPVRSPVVVTPPVQPQNRSPYLFGLLLLALGVLAFAVWRSGLIPITEGSATDVPPPIAEVTAVTVEPSTTPTIEATATELVDTSVTGEPAIVDVPTDTPAPTDTPEPTETPSPTITPSPTPYPPGTVLFFDDFSNGKSEEWVVNYGNPVVANGSISGATEWRMTIGDESWKNYEVTFTAIGWNCGNRGLGFHMRVQSVGDGMYLIWCGSEQGWYLMQRGERFIIPNTGFRVPQTTTVKASVVGNEYSVEGGSSFIDENNFFPTGGFSLELQDGILIDNVEVVALP